MLGPFGPNCFDRVETSNIVDYMDVPQVLKDWGPLLNRRNKHATLLMYFMNWHMKQPGGTPNERSSVRLLLKRSASILVGILLPLVASCKFMVS